jgi:hypothetical protein
MQIFWDIWQLQTDAAVLCCRVNNSETIILFKRIQYALYIDSLVFYQWFFGSGFWTDTARFGAFLFTLCFYCGLQREVYQIFVPFFIGCIPPLHGNYNFTILLDWKN